MRPFRCRGLKSKRADCLNCPYEECRYDRPESSIGYPYRKKYEHKIKRDYIIRRELTTNCGGFKISYVKGTTRQASTTDVEKAMKMTLEEARRAARCVRKHISERTKLFIVRKDEELERLKKQACVDIDGDSCRDGVGD